VICTPTFGQTTAEDWVNKGDALGESGKYDEALQAFNEAIRLDPQNADAWNDKGYALELLNKTTEADVAYAKANELYLQAFDMAIKLDSKNSSAWHNKGVVLVELGRYNEAIQAFHEVIKLDPQNAEAWDDKGYVLELLNKNTEADAAYAKAKELGYTGST
jgi:Flp pilus assembly protein TadD